MLRFKKTFAGLGSRVAARTLILFWTSAVIPILIYAFLADRIVSEKLNRQATDHLAQTSKSYGLLLFDRLTQTETDLSDMAALALADGREIDSLKSYKSERFRITDVRFTPGEPGAPDAIGQEGDHGVVLGLEKQNGRDVVSLQLSKQLEGRVIIVTAELADTYLWNADAVLLPSANICVESIAAQLRRCLLNEDAGSNEASLTASWPLFLAPRFGSEAWTIVTRQPRSEALQALRSFERTLPIVSLIAILLASLLSTIHIRRSHRPLALLTHVATRVAHKQFHERVDIRSNDEYEQLGRAFNLMATALSRQFTLLRTLARVDHMILTDPAPDVVIGRVLPSLPRVLRTQAIALIVDGEASASATVFVAIDNVKGVDQASTSRVCAEKLLGVIDPSHLLQPLPFKCNDTEVFGLPVEVGGELRGALVFNNPSRGRRTRLRNARAFARRFAITLGSNERRQALIKQAYYDELTGLPNRRLFKERLEHDLHLAARSRQRLAVIYIDLDRFKHVNDSLGHSAGDALLIAVCDRLKAIVRDTDTLARMGGDEFVLIASDIDRDPAHLLAGRLQSALAEPIDVQGTKCFVQASIGLTVYPEDGATVEALLRNADIAMYRAKGRGRGVVTYFEEHMNREAQQRLRVEHRLRHALESNALTLCYQPKVNLSDGSIHGVEALARWTDEELGTVSPGIFIPVAEDCGLIEALGKWALQEACMAFQRQAQAGIDLGHVSVNVSMRQLNSDSFVKEIGTVLERTGIPPAALEIELTESAVAANPQKTLSLLAELRSLGVRVSIDDFGTGYSSMSSLAVLPADTLKIDRSFIVNCAPNGPAQSVVAAIISMAHVLGKKTVAEGVESMEQLRTLRMLGCDCIQGYLTAKPMPEAALAHLAPDFARWDSMIADDVELILGIAS